MDSSKCFSVVQGEVGLSTEMKGQGKIQLWGGRIYCDVAQLKPQRSKSERGEKVLFLRLQCYWSLLLTLIPCSNHKTETENHIDS